MNERTQKFVEETTSGGDSVLERLLGGGVRQSITIPVPGWRGKPKDEGGLDARVTIWLLGYDELAKAETDALTFLRDKLKLTESDLDRLEGVRDLEVKVQTLHRALRDVERPTVVWARHASSIRQLEPDVIQALYEAFIEFSSARSPFQHIASAAELEEVISYLGKGPAAETFFSRYDSTSLRRIARSLADQLQKLTRERSSDSSSPNASDL